MNIDPTSTLTLPIATAFQMAPSLRACTDSMSQCIKQGVNSARTCPGYNLKPTKEGEHELAGLLSPAQLASPGTLILLPDAAEPHLDALLEQSFTPETTNYDGLRQCIPVFSARTDASSLSIEMSALTGFACGDPDFFLTIVCGQKLRIRRIAGQPVLDDDEMQSICFSATNYRPLRYYSERELADADEEDLRMVDAPHWLVRAVIRRAGPPASTRR